jgi:hypothetical protein
MRDTIAIKTGAPTMAKAIERRVAFGLQQHEPVLRFWEHDGVMNIQWGEVPLSFEAEYQLTRAFEKSGIHSWLQSLFRNNESRLPMTSVLTGPCYGTWIDCPADIGEKAVDILSTFIHDAMRTIIPTLEPNED